MSHSFKYSFTSLLIVGLDRPDISDNCVLLVHPLSNVPSRSLCVAARYFLNDLLSLTLFLMYISFNGIPYTMQVSQLV